MDMESRIDQVAKDMPEPFGVKFDVFKNFSGASPKKVEENLEIAKTVYNAVNTAIVDCKAQKGNYPSSKELAELLNGDNKFVTVPKGKTVAINYSESNHDVINVWVCTSKKGITGTDKDKALACYDPAINADKREAETEDPTESTTGGATENTTGSAEVGVEGNAAQTADFEYTLLCVNGGKWQINENPGIAQSVYNAVNTAMIDCKAQTGDYPSNAKLAELLNSEDWVTIPEGKTVAINYSESDHNVINIWVCTSEKEITGTDKDKELVCFDPMVGGNSAQTAEFEYTILCVNGGEWKVK